MRIGVKYCGGCNPRYNRQAFVEQLLRDFPDLELREGQAAQAEDFTPEWALVLNGCPSACSEHADFKGSKGKLVLDRAEDYARLAGIIAESFLNTDKP